MFNRVNCGLVALVMAVGVASSSAYAVLPVGDVWLGLSDQRVTTGLISEDETETTPGVRVFFASLGEDVPDFAAEPGWLGLDGTFAPGSNISFTINRALRQWSGSSFSVTDGFMSLGFGALEATSPATDSVVNGFSLTVDPEGGMHDHPDYLLLPPASDGIYALELSFSSSMPGVLTSLPVWILFSQNASEADGEAAYDWATANIPAPGVVGMLGAAGLFSLRRRR